MSSSREFKDIRGGGSSSQAKPVDDFMVELETLQTEICTAKNMVWEAVADGSLSEEYLQPLRQGVLLPRTLVHVGIRVTGGERAGHRRASPWPPASTSRTGSRTWPTRPGTPATPTTST